MIQTTIPEKFDNLQQRSVSFFLNTMPPFHAVKSKSASAKEQENAYNFIRSIYEKLYENPLLLLGKQLYPDNCYIKWQTNKDKPGLSAKIQGFSKKINELVCLLYNAVYNGQVSGDTVTVSKAFIDAKPAMLKKLTTFGVDVSKHDDDYIFTFLKGTVKGLKLLASISAQNADLKLNPDVKFIETVSEVMLFSRGVYDSSRPYNLEVFARAVNNKEGFEKAIDYFTRNSFKVIQNKHFRSNLNMVTLDYVKFYGKPDKVGAGWKTGVIAGIECTYEEKNENPVLIRLHVPYLREVMENYAKMDDELIKIFQWSKCGGCRFCVQTDKTKTKIPRFIKVGDVNCCPLFAFAFTFYDIGGDDWFAGVTERLFNFIDELFKDRYIDAELRK